MSKSIYEEILGILLDSFQDPQDEDDDCYMLNRRQMIKISTAIRKAQKQEKLLVLYKEFFDKLNIQLRNTFDIDYIYPHEFIIGYDIKSEDKELVKLFKQIKELENEKDNS